MPLLTRKTTSPLPTAAAPLSFDERLKLAAMSTSDSPFNLADHVTGPVAVPQTPMTSRGTPVANLLQQSKQLLATDGWCRDAQRDSRGRHCLYGAVKAASRGDHSTAASALSLVLEVIRREFRGDSIASFNDRCRDAGPVMRVLDGATTLAEKKGA